MSAGISSLCTRNDAMMFFNANRELMVMPCNYTTSEASNARSTAFEELSRDACVPYAHKPDQSSGDASPCSHNIDAVGDDYRI